MRDRSAAAKVRIGKVFIKEPHATRIYGKSYITYVMEGGPFPDSRVPSEAYFERSRRLVACCDGFPFVLGDEWVRKEVPHAHRRP
jgi:hypothetical protein